ncbi:MAG: hypothetical protein MUE69_21750 [Myxococcota bacterium]|jgi:hypothetical protein|nr:hypothetical protein [Myxococcota bacterium]
MRAATAPSPTLPPTPTSVPLDLRATPPSSAWHSTMAALERGDAAAWSALMPSLRALAHRIAPAFVDVVSEDDVLGELALLAHERWLPEYVDRARRGEARVSVETFLRDRLRDHLRELRRRHHRRAALLAPLVGDERFVARPPRPDELLEAADLERRAAAGATERTVLTMRAAGYDQAEIAAATKLSRPTVSRRLAAIAALLVGLGLLLLASARWRARDPEPIAAEPRETSTRPASAGEAHDETPRETSTPTSAPSNAPSNDATSPTPNEDELRREILDPWREVEPDERPLDPPTTDTSELEEPFEGPLRIPEIFRGPRTPRAPTTTSPDLIDPFARSETPRRSPPARRPSTSTNGSAADLLDPFARPASAMAPRTPSP